MARRAVEPSLPAQVLALLSRASATLATAESLTGGALGALVTGVPGASAGYVGGVVAYATEVKVSVLRVPTALIAEHGVVSAACAVAMAAGVRELTSATYGVATTGVAGPDLQEGRPVGTVFIGLSGPGGPRSIALELVGDRDLIIDRTCREALSALSDMIAVT